MDRRQFLSKLGLSAAFLPVVSSLPMLARAQAGVSPKRLINFFVSSGCAGNFYWPDQAPGESFELKVSLAPLEPYKSRLTLIEGVGPFWGTDHRFGMDNCMTAGERTSYERPIAEALGHDILNLAAAPEHGGDEMSFIDGIRQPGISDPLQARSEVLRGFSATPAPDAPAPDNSAQTAIYQFRQAALSLSEAQLATLHGKLGDLPFESEKIRTHLEAVQALKADYAAGPGEQGTLDCSALATTALDAAAGLAHSDAACMQNLPQLLDAQIENVAESFKCGQRQMANIQVMHAWGNHQFEWLGRPEQHHQSLSHWIPSDPTGQTAANFAQCHNWMSTKFLSLLQQLDVPDPLDPGKTILDNTGVLWFSEVAGSDAHVCDSIPLVVAGGLAGAIRSGQFLKFERRNIGDLFATLATAMGVPMTAYGTQESQGLITELLT